MSTTSVVANDRPVGSHFPRVVFQNSTPPFAQTILTSLFVDFAVCTTRLLLALGTALRLAGTDWMMLEIGKQRHYEILMRTAEAQMKNQ